MRAWIQSLSGLAALMGAGCLTAAATTYTVAPDGSGDFPTIQAAVDAVVDGDTIALTGGTYTGVGNRDIDFRGKAITIRPQAGTHEPCVLDCQHAGRGFMFHTHEGAGSVLEGIAVTHGLATQGGAVCCSDSSAPTLADCTFLENSATEAGGGLSCSGGSRPTISACVFSGNEADGAGGGMWCYQAAPTLEACRFLDNVAGVGGGMAARASEPVLLTCAFEGNRAPTDCGGGLFLSDHSDGSLADCCFLENQAGFMGGGMGVHWMSSAVLDHCTFAGNTADIGGGLITSSESPIEVLGCTLADNAAATMGGGMSVWVSSAMVANTIISFSTCGEGVGCTQGDATLTCCDIFGNAGGDWVGAIADQLGVAGNISADPLFCRQMHPEWPFTLHDGSPCLPESNPQCGLIGAWLLGCGPAHAPGGDLLPDPSALTLHPPAPNPMRQVTRIAWRLPTGETHARASLRIFDSAGRLVRDLVSDGLPAGSTTVRWEGRGLDGRQVAQGLYVVRLSAMGRTISRTLVVVR